MEKVGGWVERKHGKRKRYVKLHFAVRRDTHEVVGMEVTTDDVHDSKVAASLDTGSLSSSLALSMIRELGYGTWAETVGYGRLWAVETAYSTFKRLFGECALGRRLGSIVVELAIKIALYNRLVNM